MHAEYGGVVPELASRDHIRRLLPLTQQLLEQTGRELGEIDGIAYTQGPGLAGALLVGASVAASLGFALRIPVIGLHHLEGHLLSPLLADPAPAFPFVALLVSGRPYAAHAGRRRRRLRPARRNASTTPRAKRSTRPRSCSAWPIPAGRRCASSRRHGNREAFQAAAADACAAAT